MTVLALSRRHALLGAGLAAVATGLSGCGATDDTGPALVSATTSAQRRTPGTPKDGATTAASLSRFAMDLHLRLGSLPGNVVSSPYSVATAIAMARYGAQGSTATEIDAVLHADPETFAPGLSWLDQRLLSRAGRTTLDDGTKATVGLTNASSVWGQRDVTWQKGFLDDLAEYQGVGLRLTDFAADADGARRAINGWTAEHTHDRIRDLLTPGTIDRSTRMLLVNALRFAAPWATAFEKAATAQRPFTRRDASTVGVSMMQRSFFGAAYASTGDWRAVSLPYAGNELTMTVVVPDGDRTITDVESMLAGDGLATILASLQPTDQVDVGLPRWKTRTAASLKDQLSALGMPTAFGDDADFSAMTSQEKLRIGAVEHQAWITVDEAGTEAAAATGVVMGPTAVPAAPDLKVVHADRPFLYVLHDVTTRVPLFIGRVDDPTA